MVDWPRPITWSFINNDGPDSGLRNNTPDHIPFVFEGYPSQTEIGGKSLDFILNWGRRIKKINFFVELRDSFYLDKLADICLAKLLFKNLSRLFRIRSRIFRQPTQFHLNRICVGIVFVIVHLKAMNIPFQKIYSINLTSHVVAVWSVFKKETIDL